MASASVAGGHELTGKFTVGNVEINSALIKMLTTITIKMYPRTMNNVRLEPTFSRKATPITSMIPVYKIHKRKKSMAEVIREPPTNPPTKFVASKLTYSSESV